MGPAAAQRVGEGDGGGVPVGLGAGLALELGDGQMVGAAVAAEGEALPEGEALGLGVAVLGVEVGVEVGVGVAVADAVGQAVAGDTRMAFEAPLDLEPATSRAVGTTRMPRATVITKARAPHSWRQKAQEALRLSLRPAPAGACCECSGCGRNPGL